MDKRKWRDILYNSHKSYDYCNVYNYLFIVGSINISLWQNHLSFLFNTYPYVTLARKKTTKRDIAARSTVFSRLRRDSFMTLLPEAKEKYCSSPE